MTNTTNNSFRLGQTLFSTCDQMIASDSLPKMVPENKSTASRVAGLDAMLRAKYLGPSAGKAARVIVSVNPQQISQRALIRGLNDELQGHISGLSSTSLDLVKG